MGRAGVTGPIVFACFPVTNETRYLGFGRSRWKPRLLIIQRTAAAAYVFARFLVRAKRLLFLQRVRQRCQDLKV